MGIAFDDGAADALIRAANSAEGGFLGGAVEQAVQDFTGSHGRLFEDACGIRSDDRGKLAPYCDTRSSLFADSHCIRNCWTLLSKPRVSGHVGGFVHSQGPYRPTPGSTRPETGIVT
jgi:hypothetical protein